MILDALNALTNRWPNDILPTENFKQAVSEISGSATLSSRLQIDQTDSQSLIQFAEVNGLTYSPLADDFNDQNQQTLPAWQGTNLIVNTPYYVHEMRGTMFDYPVRMCLEYKPSSVQVRNSSNHQYKLERRSIVRITLPQLFPQIVLDSNKNDGGAVSTIPTSIDSKQKITLEGNFAKYFDFYAPLGMQSIGLSVLAPNFMETLLSISASFDVEFYGHELILVTEDPLYTYQVMQSLQTALESQLKYLNVLMQSWNYAPSVLPFDHLQYSLFNGPTVLKIGSFRISPRGQLIGIALIFVLILISITASK